MPPFIDDPGESSHHNGGAFGLSLWYDGSVADLESVKSVATKKQDAD